MRKKILVGALLIVIVATAGLYFWVRSAFAGDTVRVALAGQLSKALGQPVTVGSIAATIYPRITVRLGNVAIGEPAKIRVASLDVGTDFRALLSRRIEHAALHLNGARVELPLPPLAIASGGDTADDSGSPVEIVSIDEIVLSGVEIVSGGRTLRGEIDLVPQGTKGVTIRKIALNAEDTTVNLTGQISDLAGPVGTMTLDAGALNVDKLLAFANDFSAGARAADVAPPSSSTANTSAPSNAAPSAAPAANPMPSMNIELTLKADRATLGGMAIDTLAGRARLTGTEATLDPLTFNLFGGHYQGAMDVTLGAAPAFRWRAALSNIDVAAAAAFAGSPNTVSGRLAGQVDLNGHGSDAATAMKTVRGTIRLNVTNGVVRNLGLVKTVVAATSMNMDAVKASAGGSRDEPFSRLGGTFTLDNGIATTNDLRFESEDLTLTAAGHARLDATLLDFKGQVQLSEALSKQTAQVAALRASQENGRLTLPATITGSAARPQVRIDAGSMAKRAVKNIANEQGQKAIQKGLGSLFKR